MASLVLYRKYRPKTFGEVVGQEHIVTTLKSAVQHDLLSHAYLFSGSRGAGKTSVARILAKAVNCTNPNPPAGGGEPCNACESCEDIMQGRAIDLIEIDAASNRGIDEMRELREGIRFAPTRMKYKVFIIDEAHQLTKEAANALLKTLEEPPAHALFILATTEPHKMIPTILSRCQRFDFRRLSVPQMAKRLEELVQKEGAKADPEALELIAANSGGALRDAESLLDKVLTFHFSSGKTENITKERVKELLGIVDVNVVSEFLEFIVKKQAAEAVEFLNAKLEEGMDPHEFAKNVVEYLRYMLLLRVNPKMKEALTYGYTSEQSSKLEELAKAIEAQRLPKVLGYFMEAENKMKYATIVQLPLELAIVESTQSED